MFMFLITFSRFFFTLGGVMSIRDLRYRNQNILFLLLLSFPLPLPNLLVYSSLSLSHSLSHSYYSFIANNSGIYHIPSGYTLVSLDTSVDLNININNYILILEDYILHKNSIYQTVHYLIIILIVRF